MLRKKFLPYSKPLCALVKTGCLPINDVLLFIGNKAWDKAKSFSISYPNRTLALPPWHSPGEYYWPIKGCSLLVFDTGYAEQDYLNELAVCLYENYASKVRMISPDFELNVYHKE